MEGSFGHESEEINSDVHMLWLGLTTMEFLANEKSMNFS